MPKFEVQVSGQFDNVESVSVPEDYPWFINFLCGNCGEKTPKPVVITRSEEVEGVRGGNVNCRMTCKLCSRVSDVKILQDGMTYSESDTPNWAPFLSIECRGNEPKDVMFSDDVPLIIVGTEGFNFEDGFLNDGEFFSWDEKRNVEASITEFHTRIMKV